MAVSNSSWYQYPNATDSESIFNLFGYINNTVDGLFFPIIILVIWVVSFTGVLATVGKTNSGLARSFVFASFITSILSIMSSIMGFLAPKFMYLNFILLSFGIMWLKLSSQTID